MRVLIGLIIFVSSFAKAIDACQEHNYCPPQGMVHVMVSPKIAGENRKLCDGASFSVSFSLKMGMPTNILVESGPEPLRLAIVESFKKWRFGAVGEVQRAVESFTLTSACSIQEPTAPW